MELTFAPKGRLQIDEATIVFRNFSGRGDKYNREGDRNFAVIIPDTDMANALIDEGWNVKIKPPHEVDDEPFMYLPVKIKFNDRGPNVFLVTGDNGNKLDEETVGILDNVDILTVNLDVRPYDWEVNGKSGRAAYLEAMEVYQRVDRFADKYSD